MLVLIKIIRSQKTEYYCIAHYKNIRPTQLIAVQNFHIYSCRCNIVPKNLLKLHGGGGESNVL